MAQQQQQQQGGSSDNSMAPVWIMLLLFFSAFIIWKLAHQYIVAFVFKLNILQANVIQFFITNDNLSKNVYIMQTIDPATVGWSQFLTFTKSVGDYVRYPVIIILLVLAVLLYFSNITLKFRKIHTMKTLKLQEQHNWPAIMPVAKENIIEQDLNSGAWAMALSPIEFARKYKLLRKEDILLDKPLPGMEMTAGIKRGDAKRVFTLQLGPYWEGFEHCSPQAAALAAVFIARINRDRDSATMVLESIDKTFVTSKPDFSAAKKVIKKYQHMEIVQEITARHAYLLTVLASLLQKSREDGVVPSSEFLWLKPIDRRLWYMLNCVGRQTPFAEVAGPFAHWKAEKAMGRRSLVPMIDEAIKALEIAVKEVKLSPREMQELEA